MCINRFIYFGTRLRDFLYNWYGHKNKKYKIKWTYWVTLLTINKYTNGTVNLKLNSPTVSTFPILWHILCNSTVIGYELILRLKASAVNWLLFLPNWMSQNYDLFHPGIQSKKQLIFFRIGLLIWSFYVWVLEYLYNQLVHLITIAMHILHLSFA